MKSNRKSEDFIGRREQEQGSCIEQKAEELWQGFFPLGEGRSLQAGDLTETDLAISS